MRRSRSIRSSKIGQLYSAVRLGTGNGEAMSDQSESLGKMLSHIEINMKLGNHDEDISDLIFEIKKLNSFNDAAATLHNVWKKCYHHNRLGLYYCYVNQIINKGDNIIEFLSEQRAEAMEQYEEFASRFPDSIEHLEELALILETVPSLDLDEAYFALKNFFWENNLDFSMSLQANRVERETLVSSIKSKFS